MNELTLKQWISKTRSEIKFLYKQKSAPEWIELRDHWHHLASIEELEEFYPYLTFLDWSEEEDDEYDDDFRDYVKSIYKSADYDLLSLDKTYHYEHFFKSGKRSIGLNHGNEYFLFTMKPKLNDLGLDLIEQVEILLKANIIQMNLDRERIIDITPWNKREV